MDFPLRFILFKLKKATAAALKAQHHPPAPFFRQALAGSIPLRSVGGEFDEKCCNLLGFRGLLGGKLMVVGNSSSIFPHTSMFTPLTRTSLRFAVLLLLISGPLYAQGTFRDTSYSRVQTLTSVMGRDFWFAPPALFGAAGEYYQLNITSPKNTTAHIQAGTFQGTVKVLAGQTANFSLPLTQVIKTSGIVEDKGYHVWSDSADLDVMLVDDFAIDSAGDAMQILPDFKLGRQYVVAAYQAYFHGVDNSQFDYPSMITITAEHDSTYVLVLPSADLRQETETVPNPTAVAHPKGMPFTVRLEQGQSVQYKTVLPQDPTNYDLTGTILQSNYPIAVIGASQRADIPSTYDPPNYIADMIPPIRAWDTAYYTLPFYQPPGIIGHQASSFVAIGSVPNQSIYRTDANGDHLFALLDHAYDFSLQPDVDQPSKWHSNAPFMLVQYINSPDYPSTQAGDLGMPAMVVIPPENTYGLTANVQMPIYSATYPTQFNMFLNVIANANATTVTLDGKSIRSWTKFSMPDGTVLYRSLLGGMLAGAHLLASDMPVGAYSYGFSRNTGESISYAAAPGLIAPTSSTTAAPTVSWTADTSARAAISDASGISHISIDSIANLALGTDSEFAAGDSIPSTFLTAQPLDTSKNGFLRIRVYDMAGNLTTSVLSYTAPVPTSLEPGFTIASISLDTCLVGTSKTVGAVTLTDTSSYWPLTIDHLTIDNSAFTDAAVADKVPFTLAPMGTHTLQITFTPTQDLAYSTLLHVHSTTAGSQTDTLRGTGYSVNAVTGDVPASSLAAWLARGAGELRMLAPSPNPARHSIELEYALRAPASPAFEIFTILGTSLYHWTGGIHTSGEHTESLDLRSVPPGDYLYRFEADGEVLSGKLEIVP